MKILLLLAIFCAVSYASFQPKYTVTKSDSRLQVTDVIAESVPVRGQYNTINVCAIPKYSGDWWTGTWYEIGANYGSKDNIIYATGYQYLQSDSTMYPDSPMCEFYGFKVPPFAESTFYVTLYFSASENYMSEILVEFNL